MRGRGKYANNNNMTFFEVSAKTGENIFYKKDNKDNFIFEGESLEGFFLNMARNKIIGRGKKEDENKKKRRRISIITNSFATVVIFVKKLVKNKKNKFVLFFYFFLKL